MNDTEKALVIEWLGKITSIDFEGKKVVKSQLEKATVTKISKRYSHVFVEFQFNSIVPLLPFKKLGSPIQMSAHQQNKPPIFFVLIAKDGVIIELEVGTVDASELDIYNIDLSNVEYSVSSVS